MLGICKIRRIVNVTTGKRRYQCLRCDQKASVARFQDFSLASCGSTQPNIDTANVRTFRKTNRRLFCHGEVEDLVDLQKVKNWIKPELNGTRTKETFKLRMVKTTFSKVFLSVSELQLKKHLLQIARNLRPQVSWCRQEAEKICEISMEKTSCGTTSPSNVWSMGKSERFFDAKKKWTVDHIQQARWAPGKLTIPEILPWPDNQQGFTLNWIQGRVYVEVWRLAIPSTIGKTNSCNACDFLRCEVEKLVDLKVKE